MRKRSIVIAGIFLLFLGSTAFSEDNAKNLELYNKITGAVWGKLTTAPNRYRWEITSTIIKMVKEANPEKDAQLKSLDALSQINKKNIEENRGKQDAVSYTWLEMMLLKAKQTLTEHPVLSEGNTKSIELYAKIKDAVWEKITVNPASENDAQAKMLDMSNTIVKMVKETNSEKDAQMKSVIDLARINKQKVAENRGKPDYRRYVTLQALILKAGQIIKEK